MKNIFSSLLSVFILIAFQSCDKDMGDQSSSVVTQSRLTAPANNAVFTLNPNLYDDIAVVVKWTSTDFGYSASVKYVLEIIKATDNFDAAGVTAQVIPLGTFHENSNAIREYGISTTVLNAKLKNLGIAFGTTSNFKMRVFGQPSAQMVSSANGLKSYSQENTFTCNVYDPIDESPKIYVAGNFGAASTFADWSVDLLGTSNSPLIYSARKDGVYEGFVYMNNPSPQFKFANPSTTSLNIYGVGSTPFTATIVDGVTTTGTTPTPLGSAPGSLLASTVLSTGNVITTGTQGAGTYFIKADLNATQNKYFVVKRVVQIQGPTVGNSAKALVYDTNPSSPYYRMYVGNNINLIAGTGYIEFRNFSNGSDARQERMTLDYLPPASSNLVPTTGAGSLVKNKMKIGSGNFNINVPGVYTVVLDLRNSANYNLRIIN